MKPRSRQRGFVLIMVLGIGAFLFLLLGHSLQAHYALHRQNARSLRALQTKVDACHFQVAPPAPVRP